MADLSIELAMRGQSHAMEGLAKGARQAFKNWRAHVHNVNQNANMSGQPVSTLYAEYEEALTLRQAENPALDVDEDSR